MAQMPEGITKGHVYAPPQTAGHRACKKRDAATVTWKVKKPRKQQEQRQVTEPWWALADVSVIINSRSKDILYTLFLTVSRKD